MSTLKGTVKWFNGKKGFGFIEREDKEKDAFVHASAVKAAGMRYLNEGDKLEFTLEDGPKGPSAVNLKTTSSLPPPFYLNLAQIFFQKPPLTSSNLME